MKALQVRDLYFSYGARSVLEAVNFDAEQGRMYALVGRNGSGKSTLLRLLTGVIPLQRGEVLWNGTALRRLTPGQLARHVAVVWTGRPMENLRVYEVLATGMPPGFTAREKDVRIRGLAADWQMEHWLQRPVGQLSDGEARMVLIARALLQDTPVVLLDEPATHLDLVHKAQIFGLLRQLTRQGKTVIFSTHDIQLLSGLADRILLLHQGHLQELAPDEASGALERIFSHEMLTFDKQCKTFKFRKL